MSLRSAYGRKRTLVLPDIGMSERPLSGKADIKLNLDKRSANDAKQPFAPRVIASRKDFSQDKNANPPEYALGADE